MIYCDCSQDYGDTPTYHRERDVVARKEHVCCECGETIQPGTRYERVDGVWDGEWSIFCTCLTCANIRSLYCSAWVYGGLDEALCECFGFSYLEDPSEWDDDEWGDDNA